MIKESIHHKEITILNLYASHNRASKYMKQNLREMKIDKFIIKVEDSTILSQ